MAIRELVDALKYYADRDNYLPYHVWSPDALTISTLIEDDNGEKAREALEKFYNHLDKTNYNEGQ